jgi:hypothetical protein
LKLLFLILTLLDGILAAALQQGLNRFAKPLFKPRAIRVFRDEDNVGNDAATLARDRKRPYETLDFLS